MQHIQRKQKDINYHQDCNMNSLIFLFLSIYALANKHPHNILENPSEAGAYRETQQLGRIL